MATQSLYRRYRPRRFGEVKGQDHVVRALRHAVAEGRAGQAYLFSGPRGTGKTTSARILAKVLNCEQPVDGEPCCECESCLAVERGTSFDVHELDAASNNGVDAMRDLIEKASLGTPGRHKVYILDEVHMLSKAAEASLLKTLEEPPNHVVFVLATTDPQKMSDTIRSRTQHLQFHLLPADTLREHVRWVAADAGLEVSDDAVSRVIASGGGSPRDTLSALELVANSGVDGVHAVPVGDVVEAMIDQDPARALATVAEAIALGRDPRALTDDLIAHLRNGFLSLMAPDLVQLPSPEVGAVADQAERLGAPGLVRAIELLGEMLGEMRHAPDPRVLLDVTVVRLTSPRAATDVAGLAERVRRLEERAAGPAPTGEVTSPADRSGARRPAERPASRSDAPRDPATGRAAVGGRAQRAVVATAASESGSKTGSGSAGAGDADSSVAESGERSGAGGAEGADPSVSESESGAGAGTDPTAPAPESIPDAGERPVADTADLPAGADPAGAGERAAVVSAGLWQETVVPGLRGMARAVYAPATFADAEPGSVTLALPNDVHLAKCEQHRATVEQALAAAAGAPVVVHLVLAGQRAGDGSGAARGDSAAAGAADAVTGPVPDDDIDLDDLVDAPPEAVRTPIDRLAEAFPGSELVDEGG